MMLELLQIYWPTIAISILCASSLSIFGGHILARREGLSIFSLSQIISTSILLSMLIVTHESLQLVITVFLALLFACALKLLEQKAKLRHDTLHLSTFIFFMAINYAISSYFPNLEAHLAKSFFGDVVTLSGARLIILSSVMLTSVMGFVYFHKEIFNQTFDMALATSTVKDFSFYKSIQLIVLTICIFNLGLLFTLTFVFLPSAITKLTSTSLRSHYRQCIVVSIMGVTIGMLTSLAFDRVATVPAITIATVLFGLILSASLSKLSR